MITSQFIAVLHKTALYWKILYNRVGYAVMFILDMTVLYMTFTWDRIMAYLPQKATEWTVMCFSHLFYYVLFLCVQHNRSTI